MDYLGEIYHESKQIQKAEEAFLKAQNIIGRLFSDDHPSMINYNVSLMNLYGSKESDADKLKCI